MHACPHYDRFNIKQVGNRLLKFIALSLFYRYRYGKNCDNKYKKL